MDLLKFKAQLDEAYTWPAPYIFKFVVPIQNKSQLISKIPKGDVSQRHSKGGKYLSLTVKSNMASADEIITVYRQVATVEGLISL